LKSQFENLKSIDGIAEISAIAIIVEVQSIDKFVNARQLAVYCGLTPRICESGTFVHKKTRIFKFGKNFLRKALYFPAIVAIQRCEQFHRHSQKLLSRGKAKKQIIVAVMKKILLVTFSILKYDWKFDSDLIFKTHWFFVRNTLSIFFAVSKNTNSLLFSLLAKPELPDVKQLHLFATIVLFLYP